MAGSVNTGCGRISTSIQCGVGELRATTGDGAGALQDLAQAGREGGIAGRKAAFRPTGIMAKTPQIAPWVDCDAN
jgi:hypothetical protein